MSFAWYTNHGCANVPSPHWGEGQGEGCFLIKCSKPACPVNLICMVGKHSVDSSVFFRHSVPKRSTITSWEESWVLTGRRRWSGRKSLKPRSNGFPFRLFLATQSKNSREAKGVFFRYRFYLLPLKNVSTMNESIRTR